MRSVEIAGKRALRTATYKLDVDQSKHTMRSSCRPDERLHREAGPKGLRRRCAMVQFSHLATMNKRRRFLNAQRRKPALTSTFRIPRASTASVACALALLILGMFSSETRSVEDFQFRGQWAENPACGPNDERWEVGSFVIMPGGNILKGIGDLAITINEWGCKLSKPTLHPGNEVRFQAACATGKSSRGEIRFQFITPEKMRVTFPVFVSTADERRRAFLLYKCKDELN
jgi:hypothetical protein